MTKTSIVAVSLLCVGCSSAPADDLAEKKLWIGGIWLPPGHSITIRCDQPGHLVVAPNIENTFADVGCP